jgi:peroxiredoxin
VPDRPLPVVLTTGDLTRNRALFDASGFAGPVLLQVEMEVASAYKVDGTPMSYLIEADGSIASELAVGIQATLILAGEMESVADATSTANAPGLSDRRPVRNGLTPGESAPVFRLPRLDGGELSLLEYRGRQVIVVFSDVECEPCDRLAPQLVDAHRAQPDLPIVIVGRGDAEKNRAKVEEFGLPFPVVLQRHWEVSQEYGLLAAPIAYLVDEWGVIASGVAVGPDAVMELITFVSESSDKKPISL